jgi:hypothetical protein
MILQGHRVIARQARVLGRERLPYLRLQASPLFLIRTVWSYPPLLAKQGRLIARFEEFEFQGQYGDFATEWALT